MNNIGRLIVLDRTADLTAPITDAGVIKMSPKEWAGVPDNPRQRDTAAHAKRAAHLKVPHPTHAFVNMALLPDGRRFKLDGHTRSYLWEAGDLAAPDVLSVQTWLCASLDEVKQLYSTFDSTDAVETGKDKLHGGLRELGLTFQSDVLTKGRYLNALSIAYELLFGQQMARSRGTYDLLAYWAPELKLFDACNGEAKRFHAGTIAAALLTLRRYGTAANEFWTTYARNRGMKIGDEMDGVQALDERITGYIKKGRTSGRAHSVRMVACALSAFERHRRSELYKAEMHGGGVKPLQPQALKDWLITAKNTLRSW